MRKTNLINRNRKKRGAAFKFQAAERPAAAVRPPSRSSRASSCTRTRRQTLSRP